MLAHIGKVPVEESLIYVAPVVLVVAWIYFQGWRERRKPALADRAQREAPEPLRQSDEDGR